MLSGSRGCSGSGLRSRSRGSLRSGLLLDRGRSRGRGFLLLAGNEGGKTKESYEYSESEPFHFLHPPVFVLRVFGWYKLFEKRNRFFKPL